MKAFSYPFYAEESKHPNREIALFKRVEIIPNSNSFLSSKITLQNYCIMSFQSGLFDWKFNNTIFRITPEDLILVCPGVEMEKNFRPIEMGDFYKISLNPDYYFDENTPIPYSGNTERSEISFILRQFKEHGFLFLKNTEEANTLFRKLEEEFRNSEVGHRVRISSLINELIISTYRNFSQVGESPLCNECSFDELTNLLKASLSHPWTVKEMADLAGMGITQLSHRMKTRLGYSPFDYLIYLRMHEALRLLDETEDNITGIALDTGFYSSQHFSNSFRKIIGDTPRNYRKNLRYEGKKN